MILSEDVLVPILKLRISSATTANPLPASPALAASMDAFKASRFVWDVIPVIIPVSALTFSNSSLKSFKILSTSADNSAISVVDFTTSSSCAELVLACATEPSVKVTTSEIRPATLLTCISMVLVISREELVLSESTILLAVSPSILRTTLLAPSIFSSESSLTTVTPSTTDVLAVLTCSMVLTTRSRLSFTAFSIAPSDLER